MLTSCFLVSVGGECCYWNLFKTRLDASLGWVDRILLFDSSEAHDVIDGYSVRKRPEESHDEQTAQNVLAFEGFRAEPDEMEDENACSQPIEIM